VRDGGVTEEMAFYFELELRYAGQAYELGIPLPPGVETIAAIADAFHVEHARTYGHSSPGAPVDLVSVKVAGRSRSQVAGSGFGMPEEDGGSAEARRRAAYFGPRHGVRETKVLRSRRSIGEAPQPGPLIVDEYDATAVVPPDCTARVDRDGNLFIRLGQDS
jgi:N-methylhydantoinase A